jgi:hypothetical protein
MEGDVMDQETEFTGEFATGAISKNGEVVARLVSADRDFFDRTVLAVNAHEALVSACAGMVDVIDKIKPLPTGGIPLKKAYDALRAALRKAGAL